MASWGTFDKLKYIVVLAVVGMAGLYGHDQWQSIPQRALVPGGQQSLDHTIDVQLRSKTKTNSYRLFSRADIDSVLSAAQLRLSDGTTLGSVQLTGDSGRVHWRNGRFDSHTVPGAFIRVQASIATADEGKSGEDTLWLRLPGLSRLGERDGEAAWISWGGVTPRPGDSVMVQRFQRYQTLADVQRARIPYLVLQLFAVLLFAGIVVRAILRTVGDGMEIRRALARAPAASKQPHLPRKKYPH